MIQRIFLLTTVFLLFVGCGRPEPPIPTMRPTVSATPLTVEPEASPAPSESPEEGRKEDLWLVYAERYGTDHVFTDLYIPEKLWLIGEENIVQLVSFVGNEDIRVFPRTSIERVEHLLLDEFGFVDVYDKTNECISITLTPSDAEAILELLY